ncbi:MAG: carboxypeptidase regulatory-like domain-containing protein, partial [Planctomycetes bacterium]|nr:carboxypeptidase regulatory-like domain-containing protein [Planctomycetota bacterium]
MALRTRFSPRHTALIAAFAWALAAAAPSPRIAPGPVIIRTVASGTGKPVAAALVHLGGRYAHSGSDGILTLDGVPAGTYPLRIEQKGYASLGTSVTLPAGSREPIRITLDPIEMARVEGRIILEDSGEIVPGANVVLAPSAVPSSTRGTFTFAADWEGKFAILEIPPGAYAARVTAPGCAERASTVEVKPGPNAIEWKLARVTPRAMPDIRAVEAEATAPVAEREPNNGPAEAQLIQPATTITLVLDRRDDQDWFRFRLPQPALARVAIPVETPLNLNVSFRDAGERELRGVWSTAGRAAALEKDLAAGEYTLRVAHSGPGSEKPFALAVTALVIADPGEPNNGPAEARILRPGQIARGFIFPLGDADWYRLDLARPSMVRFTIPSCPFESFIAVCDPMGREVASHGFGKGADVSYVVSLPAGRHLVRVNEWYSNAFSTEPYALRADLAEDDGIGDGAEASGSAPRPLALNEMIGATICPIRDVDVFRLAIPSRGILHIEAVASTELLVAILGTGERAAPIATTGAKRPLHLIWGAKAPGTVDVAVREWFDNDWNASPYTLCAWFEPCDEAEMFDANETPAMATPIEPGDVLRGSIAPVGDVDVYRLYADHPGQLHLAGKAPTELVVRVLDAHGKVLLEHANGAGHPIDLHAGVAEGDVFIRFEEWYNNAASAIPYEIRADLLRAEPYERAPLAGDPPRHLKLGEAAPYRIEQFGDRDRFLFDAPEKGTYAVWMNSPVEKFVRIFDDRTGERVSERGFGAGKARIDIAAKGPARYRLEISEWYDNAWSMEPGYVMVDAGGREIAADAIEAVIDPIDPTNVMFLRREAKGFARPQEVIVDADGDGKPDLDLSAAPARAFRYRSEGLYLARARMTAATGTSSWVPIWVQAIGAREREGVSVDI